MARIDSSASNLNENCEQAPSPLHASNNSAGDVPSEDSVPTPLPGPVLDLCAVDDADRETAQGLRTTPAPPSLRTTPAPPSLRTTPAPSSHPPSRPQSPSSFSSSDLLSSRISAPRTRLYNSSDPAPGHDGSHPNLPIPFDFPADTFLQQMNHQDPMGMYDYQHPHNLPGDENHDLLGLRNMDGTTIFHSFASTQYPPLDQPSGAPLQITFNDQPVRGGDDAQSSTVLTDSILDGSPDQDSQYSYTPNSHGTPTLPRDSSQPPTNPSSGPNTTSRSKKEDPYYEYKVDYLQREHGNDSAVLTCREHAGRSSNTPLFLVVQWAILCGSLCNRYLLRKGERPGARGIPPPPSPTAESQTLLPVTKSDIAGLIHRHEKWVRQALKGLKNLQDPKIMAKPANLKLKDIYDRAARGEQPTEADTAAGGIAALADLTA